MSVTYKRIPYRNEAKNSEGFRYQKGNLLTKESRIPHEVMEKFEFTDTVEYDEAPERRRCIFCDAPQKRQRYLNGDMVDLCEWHYQHARLGQIAAQVREVEKEQQAMMVKEQERKEEVSRKWHDARKKKRKRTTTLSAMIQT